MRRLGRRLALLCAGALCSSCLTLHAALQSTEGELTLLLARRPIAQLLDDPRTPARLGWLLRQIAQVKQFGEENGLTPTANYQDYVQLHRPSVVYVVSACEPLRFQSKTWSFPIAGEFPYLGWFDLRSAQEYARDLEEEGLDVEVRGAQAYSTLGFFRDPVLSSMIGKGPEALGELVNVVLHESVHATLHLEGQAPFNESLASFVAGDLTRSYLEKRKTLRERAAWEREGERAAAATRALQAAHDELQALYASAATDLEKRARKATVLAALEKKLGLRRHPNNATLAQFKTYHSGEQGFSRLLQSCARDFRCFFARLRTLTTASFALPQQEELDELLLRLTASGAKR